MHQNNTKTFHHNKAPTKDFQKRVAKEKPEVAAQVTKNIVTDIIQRPLLPFEHDAILFRLDNDPAGKLTYDDYALSIRKDDAQGQRLKAELRKSRKTEAKLETEKQEANPKFESYFHGRG